MHRWILALIAVAASSAPVAPAEAKRVRWNYALASWYGPGLLGNTMACGGTLTAGTLGVAHKTLRCGTKLRVCFKRCRNVRVVDRGPFVGGRVFDLTQATKYAIGFPSVAVIRWRLNP